MCFVHLKCDLGIIVIKEIFNFVLNTCMEICKHLLLLQIVKCANYDCVMCRTGNQLFSASHFDKVSRNCDCESSWGDLVQVMRRTNPRTNNLNMCIGPVLIWWLKSLWCWNLPVLQERKGILATLFASLIINKTNYTVMYNRSLRVTSRKKKINQAAEVRKAQGN